MISRTGIESAVLAQLQAVITQLSGSILHYLDKPEQMTAQVIGTRHPSGLMLVQYDESETVGLTETVLVSVICAATTASQVVKLGDAAREALNAFTITGGSSRMELHDDKALGREEGIFFRSVRFRVNTPAVPQSDRAAAVAAIGL